MQTALGQNFSKNNPIRQVVGGYITAAGVEAGYGFFAPNISGAEKLIFELHYADGRVEYETPNVRSKAAALRVASLYDIIARVKDESVRVGLIKYLAYSTWREHPGLVSIRALLGAINFPSPHAFARGESESYDASRIYDFSFDVTPPH